MVPRVLVALFLIYIASMVDAVSEKLEERVPKCFMEDPEILKLGKGKRLFLERAAKDVMRESKTERTEVSAFELISRFPLGSSRRTPSFSR